MKQQQTTEAINAAWKKHANDFHVAHSSALIAWQKVEDNLFFIFDSLVDSKSPDVGSAIFYSLNGLHARLNIIQAIIEKHRNKEKLLPIWCDLYEKIKSEAKSRNNLAHCDATFNLGRKGIPSLKLDKSKFDIKSPELKAGINQMKVWQTSFELLAPKLYEFYLNVDGI